jgi:hypothetical protein
MNTWLSVVCIIIRWTVLEKGGKGKLAKSWRDNGIWSENRSGWRDFGTRYWSLYGKDTQLVITSTFFVLIFTRWLDILEHDYLRFSSKNLLDNSCQETEGNFWQNFIEQFRDENLLWKLTVLKFIVHCEKALFCNIGTIKCQRTDSLCHIHKGRHFYWHQFVDDMLSQNIYKKSALNYLCIFSHYDPGKNYYMDS